MKTGFRYDSTPIANGLIKAGASCDLIKYTPDDHTGFAVKIKAVDVKTKMKSGVQTLKERFPRFEDILLLFNMYTIPPMERSDWLADWLARCLSG